LKREGQWEVLEVKISHGELQRDEEGGRRNMSDVRERQEDGISLPSIWRNSVNSV
jgi:hypothetical protein